MLSHPLSFESILVSSIGLMILLLLACMIAVVSLGSDQDDDGRFDSENEFRWTSVMSSSRNRTLEIEQNLDAT